MWCKPFSTSTPKPRAEGSIPSAPAIQRSETAWFRSFFGTFWADCFGRTSGDAVLTLKSSHPLPTIPPDFVRCSIKKASKHQLPRLGIRQPGEPLYCFMWRNFCAGSKFKSCCNPRQSGGVRLDVVQLRDFRGGVPQEIGYLTGREGFDAAVRLLYSVDQRGGESVSNSWNSIWGFIFHYFLIF